MERLDLILAIVEIVMAAALFFVAGYAAKAKSNKWRMLYFLPVLVCLLVTGYTGADTCMLGVYIGSVLTLVGFARDNERIRKIACVAAAICVSVSIPVCYIAPTYRAVDYVEDFETGFRSMEQHYVLSEHKGIDWDALYDEYLPMFRKANAERDEVANCIAWMKFTAEFHDGHVGYSPADNDVSEAANDILCGNDYGLSLVQLSDGRVVAVNVEPESALTEAGITDGTVITAWDGMDILEAAEKSEGFGVLLSHADLDNELFYKAMYAAGVGGDTVTVSYIAQDGSEKQITLEKLGSYKLRLLDTMDILHRGVDAGNLCWAQVSEDTACLRIKSMMSTTKEEEDGAYDPMQRTIREKIAEYEALGCDKLIIDLRENGGGSGLMVKSIAELFAPVGEHYYCTDALWDETKGCYATDENGNYIKGKDNYYTGEDIWGGKPIVLLVNAHSASAADHLSDVLRGFDNVTVMGFTEPNGSAQGVNGEDLETGVLGFSSALLLDEDGGIFIDAGTDRESGDDIDVRVPFDEAAVQALFVNDEDYVLNYALDHMADIA